jgi:hypothetical protein
MPDTFIERHGLIKYGSGLPALPRPRWCEICKSPDHVAYQLDHCHAHGWVRGVLCSVCNRQMRNVDAGRMPLMSPWMEHWNRCPDCLKIGEVPPQPRERRRRFRGPLMCAGCGGNGVIWLPSVGRMADCPICRHPESPEAGTESVTKSDGFARALHLETVTERDENGAPENGQGEPAPLGARSARVVPPDHETVKTPVTVRVLPPAGAAEGWSLIVTTKPGVPVSVVIQVEGGRQRSPRVMNGG